jgi:hypothetical protein
MSTVPVTGNGRPVEPTRAGYFVIQMTELNGKDLGRYGPYSLPFVRKFFASMTRDVRMTEHAIALAVQTPAWPIDLADIRKNTKGEEYIAWSCRLYYHLRA